jgi:hypothetical protein
VGGIGPAEVGSVSVTVRVEEPSLPSNYDEQIFTFNVVAPSQLAITSTSPLADGLVGISYSQALLRSGGSAGAQWTIVGGTNHGWLSVDAGSGLLSGTPGAGDLGPVTVTVRVEEPLFPTNFDEVTFALSVYDGVWSESFEGGCPAGWTLGGNWQCGVPTSGPGAAYDGSNCLATNLAGDYSSNQTWTGCVADSPAIDLSGTTAPLLRFRLWLSTEGSSFDGANVKVSTDCSSYSLLTTNKTYNATVNGESAWNGNESGSGWQLVTADLSAYAGQTICLRFAFRSDGSITYPGPYVDAVQIVD